MQQEESPPVIPEDERVAAGRPAAEAPSSGNPQSRRNVLIGSGVAVVAAAGGYVGFIAYGPQSKADAPNQNAPYGVSTGAGTGAAAAQVVLAKVADIPENGGVVLTTAKIVLTRSTGDLVHAFTAVCTHQQCLVGSVSGGKIHCPCHGSAFDAGTGAVVNGPATAALAAVGVDIVNGEVRQK